MGRSYTDLIKPKSRSCEKISRVEPMAGIGRPMSVFRFQITDSTQKFKVLWYCSDEPILTELLKLLLKVSVEIAPAFPAEVRPALSLFSTMSFIFDSARMYSP